MNSTEVTAVHSEKSTSSVTVTFKEVSYGVSVKNQHGVKE